MFHAVLAEVVYIVKLTDRHILVKYNCTRMFFEAVVVYIIKHTVPRTSSAISSYTTRVCRITVKYFMYPFLLKQGLF